MIRAFSAALEDDNLLVRRATLDLLLQSVRLDGSVIKRAQAEDRTILMGAATGVVLRRDSALNRRLYTWLLGTAEDSDSQIQYLKANSLELLCSTLKVTNFACDKKDNAHSIYSRENYPLPILFRMLNHSRFFYQFWTSGK